MTDDCSSTTPALLSITETLERLLEAAAPVAGREQLSLERALGRVLADDVTAPIAVPGHDNSAMDGYALRLADLGPGRLLPVGLTVPAGAAPAVLPPGCAARIFTGAPVPLGADAVVMQEQCEAEAGGVRFPDVVAAGQNIRRAGEDIAAGSVVLGAGSALTPAAIGLLASVGIAEVAVLRRPRVALLSTGNELVAPGTQLLPGQIYDSNGPLLAALLARLGLDCLPPRRLPDQLEATVAALDEAAAAADVLITTGGVSVGDADHVKPAVARLGRLALWRIAMKPGKPFAFGFVGDTPLLGLPGNPVSTFITFLLLARPFLLRMAGRPDEVAPMELPVLAGFDWPRPDRRREEYLRVRLGRLNGKTIAELYPHQGSGVLSSCAWAHGLVRVEPGRVIRRGDCVPYLPLSDLLG